MTTRVVIETNKDKALEQRYKFRIDAEKKTQATLQRMQKDFVASINAYALVLVLLATVTYAGFLQPPGNLTDGKRMVPKRPVTVFIVFNSLSFYFSVADLLLCVISSLSPLASISSTSGKEQSAVPEISPTEIHLTLQSEQVKTQNISKFVASTLFNLIIVNFMFGFSLTCCVVAFGAAGFVVVNNNYYSANYLAVVITSSIGGVLFFLFMVWLLKDTIQFIGRYLSDRSLSTSLQNRAGSLQVQYRYLDMLQ